MKAATVVLNQTPKKGFMGRVTLISILIALFTAVEFQAQTPAQKAPEKPALNAEQLAMDWADSMTALSNWYLSVDGKEEGVNQNVDRIMAMFAPDIVAEMPPHDENQLGPVQLIGTAQVRKWVEKMARSQMETRYMIKRQTMKQFEGEWMVYSKPLPWGGLGVSFQVLKNFYQREDRRHYMEVGGVFLQFHEDGKIYRLRLVLGEKEEITGANFAC
jgi:hypothetical protein